MMGTEIKRFIIALLEKKQRLPECEDIGSYRYLDAGHIDSLGIMNFILQLEDKFEVEISDDDMLSELFQTVDGLTKIVLGKV
jgi:D-alanine--poly(phosphoribitol) ligase subunit 2